MTRGSIRYEPVRPPRFRPEWSDGVERLRLRARRNWFVLPFLCVWLTMWTFGGFAAMGMFAQTHEPFLAVWLIGWAAGWLFAAVTISWQLSGAEVLWVQGGDLYRRVAMLGYTRQRIYRGAEVRGLAETAPSFWFNQFPSVYPPLFNLPTGGASFRYGARTIVIAGGADAAEGAMIAEWLRARLPASAA